MLLPLVFRLYVGPQLQAQGQDNADRGEVIPTEKRVGGDREGGGLCSVQADNCPGRAMNIYHPPLPPAAAAYMLPKIIPRLNVDNMSCDAFIVP